MPLRAGLHNPPGSIGGRQPAYSAMRPHMVVVVAPAAQHRAGMAQRREQRPGLKPDAAHRKAQLAEIANQRLRFAGDLDLTDDLPLGVRFSHHHSEATA